MVSSRETIEKIREIISKHYNSLVISVLGKDVFSKKELEELERLGVDTSNKQSLLSLVYYHNFINYPVDDKSPKTVEDAERQQTIRGLKPEGEANDYASQNINEKTRQFIDKMKQDITTRIETIIRENNDSYRNNAIQNLNRDQSIDDLMKESSLGKVKQQLMDTAGDADRDWLRIAITEVSNAIGIGSIDRIVTDNVNKDSDEIYVYRVIVKDARTCKWCRKFYQDSDDTPKLYKLSTLLNNGSNYGKKYEDWNPVSGATHPHERCSQPLELKPGFALTSDGVTYIGLDSWHKYIVQKLAG